MSACIDLPRSEAIECGYVHDADAGAPPAARRAKVIDGKAVSAEIREELAADVEALKSSTGKVEACVACCCNPCKCSASH